MSPEQMRSARDTDARTDIWSLGVTLFVLVTGRYPFEGEGLVGLERAIRNGPRPAMGADVPPPLGAIVERCLRYEPSHRYETAADLGRELAQYAAGEPSLFADRAYSPAPSVVEPAVLAAERDATKSPLARAATLALGTVAALALAAFLVARVAAHRPESGQVAATATEPGRASPDVVSTRIEVPSVTTSVAAPAGGPLPLGTTPLPAPAVAVKSPAGSTPAHSVHRAVTRAASEAPVATNSASAVTPHAASAADPTLRDFDAIRNLPRR
jgi:serine/threonine-protein kinase